MRSSCPSPLHSHGLSADVDLARGARAQAAAACPHALESGSRAGGLAAGLAHSIPRHARIRCFAHFWRRLRTQPASPRRRLRPYRFGQKAAADFLDGRRAQADWRHRPPPYLILSSPVGSALRGPTYWRSPCLLDALCPIAVEKAMIISGFRSGASVAALRGAGGLTLRGSKSARGPASRPFPAARARALAKPHGKEHVSLIPPAWHFGVPVHLMVPTSD